MQLLGVFFSLGLLAIFCSATIRFIWHQNRKNLLPALSKAFFLWIISSFPIFASLLLGAPTSIEGELHAHFFDNLKAKLYISEIFIYSAAFVSPVLYVVFDMLRALKDNEMRLNLTDISRTMRGMEGVVLTAIIILLLSSIAYSGSKFESSGFGNTFIFLFFQDQGYILYVASFLIWYSVILWEKSGHFSFESSEKEDTMDFKHRYARRSKGFGND